ncbi:MAG: hypothetical protein EAZ55_00495 [Cytophagales bacterium]|nr:MAG: hypothetical protein EAZ55_00495 [Cytophagales bacterium]
MKQFTHFFFSLITLTLFAGVLTSCSKGVKPIATVNIENLTTGKTTYQKGEALSFKVTATASGGFEQFEIAKIDKATGVKTVLKFDEAPQLSKKRDSTFSASYTYIVNETPGSYAIRVTVQNPDNPAVETELAYTVIDGPGITGFAPNTGVVGTTVIITGEGFSATPANNTVRFNNTNATVTAATANSLTVTVPTGATTGKISVTVNSKTGTSSGDFTVAAATGGGGTVFGTKTVNLGSEGNFAVGSYLATSTGIVYFSSQAFANISTIDVTFGLGTSGTASLISPDARSSVGLTQYAGSRTTLFKLETPPAALNTVTFAQLDAITVANTSTRVAITVGNTYAFVNTSGKKGYMRIKTITGTGNNLTAEIEYIVQQ